MNSENTTTHGEKPVSVGNQTPVPITLTGSSQGQKPIAMLTVVTNQQQTPQSLGSSGQLPHRSTGTPGGDTPQILTTRSPARKARDTVELQIKNAKMSFS